MLKFFKHNLPHRWGALAFFFVSIVLLFLGFYRNEWNVVRPGKFKNFQQDSESLVIARMVESRQNGIAAHNGLLGWGDAHPPELNESDYIHQYDVYLAGGNFGTYSLYKSVPGFQAMLFSALDEISPFAPVINLRNFRVLSSFLFGFALAIFLLWIFREFGWLTALLTLLGAIVSQWMTLFGRNLFYSIWASFLPMGIIAWYLVWEERKQHSSNARLAALGFAGILTKCLMNGYDFIIPALAMPLFPLLYYCLRDRWDLSKLTQRTLVLAFSLMAAVLVSILILAAQLRVSEGSFLGGIISIFSTLSRRSYGDPSLYPLYAESLKASPWPVLREYFVDDTAIFILGLRFIDLIMVFAGFTLLYFLLEHWRRSTVIERAKMCALIATTWLSILSPVVWFVVFKGQAYVHTHTNYLAWHMPFTLFGFAMCGFVLWSSIQKLRPTASR
jgi:hypothetical protein